MTTWPSSSAASPSPPDFTAHALSRPPRKKPEPFSQPGRQAEHDQQKLRNTSFQVEALSLRLAALVVTGRAVEADWVGGAAVAYCAQIRACRTPWAYLACSEFFP